MRENQVEAVLIAGPTASGKSALALRIARATGGTVINADSMQVYRDLRVLTARPMPAEERLAPHRLFGEIDGAENFSVGRYARAVAHLLAEIAQSGSLPVLVGGTGLYFRALTDGLSAIPEISPDIRDRVRAEAEGVATADLHAHLRRLDPEGAAQLRPTDRQRVLRSIEVVSATGRSLLSFQGTREPGSLAGKRLLPIFLNVDRDTLRERIDRRFEQMIEDGALAEVISLAERRLDPALPVMRAHGVPGLLAHLRGETTLAEAIRRGQADTRAYAKRQETWFRSQMPDFGKVRPEAAPDVALRALGRRTDPSSMSG